MFFAEKRELRFDNSAMMAELHSANEMSAARRGEAWRAEMNPSTPTIFQFLKINKYSNLQDSMSSRG